MPPDVVHINPIDTEAVALAEAAAPACIAT
jgi:hypothetical protein